MHSTSKLFVGAEVSLPSGCGGLSEEGQAVPEGAGLLAARVPLLAIINSVLLELSRGPPVLNNIRSVGSCGGRSPAPSWREEGATPCKVALLPGSACPGEKPSVLKGLGVGCGGQDVPGDGGRSWRRDRSWAKRLELMQIRPEDGSRKGQLLPMPSHSVYPGPDTSGGGQEKSSGGTSAFILNAALAWKGVCACVCVCQ